MRFRGPVISPDTGSSKPSIRPGRLALNCVASSRFGVINVASAHALVASPFKSAYVAAKHGILGLTKTAALETARFGITVNAICPGYVWTPLVEKQIEDTAKARGITRDEVINNVLLSLGVIHQPLALLQTDFAVYIGIVYSYLPFMILPLYTNLEKHDPTLLEAAADLGARPLRAFLAITLPQSAAGILAGSLLVFIPAVGEYVIPTLLGRTDQLMIGRVLSDEFFENRDWPVASAVAIVVLLLLVVPIILFQRLERRELEAQP